MPAKCLKDIKLLFEEERAEIEALDTEKLSIVISKMESVLSEVESLNRQKNADGQERLMEHERALIIRSLAELSDMGSENLKRLLQKREETLAQLKEIRTKRAALKAYSNTRKVKNVFNTNR